MSGSKKYYRIGEVCKLVGLEAHIIRYWESVFPAIRPRRASKQRLYRAKDLETILVIKKLLYEEGFTIAGAKKKLAGNVVQDKRDIKKNTFLQSAGCATCRETFMGIRSELLSLIEKLKQ